MPFKRQGPNDYTSPSGRHFNQAQVRLYYANNGFPGQKKAGGGPVNAKTSTPLPASFAKGGPVIQTMRSQFAKDVFRGPPGTERTDYPKKGKGGTQSVLTGDKSEKPIKPRT